MILCNFLAPHWVGEGRSSPSPSAEIAVHRSRRSQGAETKMMELPKLPVLRDDGQSFFF